MAGKAASRSARVFDIGVVIAGAGARGAYEAGLLGHLLPELARRTQANGRVARFWFMGTSAGSLNSALIASRAPRVRLEQSPDSVHEMWTEAMDEVGKVWGNVSEGRVLGLLPSGRLIGAMTRLVPGAHIPLVSVLNIEPLEHLARDPHIVDWGQLHERVADGTVGAVGVSATARDGRTVVFMDRHDAHPPIPRDDRRDIDYADCPDGIEAAHVLASAAIPCLFPAHRVTSPSEWAGWYYDGGVRLNTPIKPAIKWGLDHLVIVSTHPDSYQRDARPDPTLPQPEIDEAAVPVANQIMADQLIQDLQTLRSRSAAEPKSAVHYLFAGPPSFGTLAELANLKLTQHTLARILRSLLIDTARGELSSYLLFDQGYLASSVTAGHTRAAEDVLPPGRVRIPWRT